MRVLRNVDVAALSVLSCLLLAVSASAETYTGTEWTQRGVEYWTDVNVCDNGTRQSPINLQIPAQSSPDLGRVRFQYRTNLPDSDLVLSNNGHTVELLLNPPDYSVGGRANVPPPPTPPTERAIILDGRRFVLDSFHFHVPSEHLWDGKRYAMELHFVHKAPPLSATVPAATAVVAVFLDDAANQENAALKIVFDKMKDTAAKGSKAFVALSGGSMMSILPPDTTYVRYTGSLTTPPCTEGINWVVLKNAVSVSTSQIDMFKAAIKTPLGIVGTAIPVNARNSRAAATGQELKLSPTYPAILGEFCRFVGDRTPPTFSCGVTSGNSFGNNDVSTDLNPGHNHLPRFLVDVNADGKPDYCRFVGNAPGIYLSCTLQTATGFGPQEINSAPGFEVGRVDLPRVMVDVNGDGRADYCRFLGSPIAYLSCGLAGANGFGNNDIHSAPGTPNMPCVRPGEICEGRGNLPRFMADVNGDGRADFCRFFYASAPYRFDAYVPDSTPTLSCALQTGTGFGVTAGGYDFNSAPGIDVGHGDVQRFMADVNGDGRADYCRFVGTAPNISFSCALAGANGFGNYDVNAKLDRGHDNMPRFLVDVNGDGAADYCRFVGIAPNVRLSCALSTGTGFGEDDVNSPGGYDQGHPDRGRFLSSVPK